MNRKEYVLFVIENKCNSKCGICLIEGTDGALIDIQRIPLFSFKKILGLIPQGKFSGIIFSGGEVTLNEQLSEYASCARDQGFRNIMIQTNARALLDLRKAKQLKSAGINQFYVSFHSANNDLSDRITGRTGAHSQTVKALENLDKLDLAVITNTVMSSMNYMVLPEIAEFLRKFSNIVEMQFSGYMPLSSHASELILPYALAAPYLNKTIKYLVSHRREIGVKDFPVCLLDDSYKKYFNNDEAKPIGVKENLWNRIISCNFQKYPCCEGTDCKGVPEIYKSTMPSENWMPSMQTRGTF